MIDRMSSMISEILHEEQRSVVTTQELLDAVMAQISSAEYADLVHTENRAPEAKIRINKIRFSRVLINLVENAAYAVRRPDGKIWIRVEETEGAEIRFQVEDNGTGIPRELLGEIWEKGFSIRSSSGLGLNFVQQVVEQCGGSVELESVEREGTVVTVSLPPCDGGMCVRQDQYELKGAVLEAPLEWQGLRAGSGRGASWLRGWRGRTERRLPAAADRS